MWVLELAAPVSGARLSHAAPVSPPPVAQQEVPHVRGEYIKRCPQLRLLASAPAELGALCCGKEGLEVLETAGRQQGARESRDGCKSEGLDELETEHARTHTEHAPRRTHTHTHTDGARTTSRLLSPSGMHCICGRHMSHK
jgi:hypothetical protein